MDVKIARAGHIVKRISCRHAFYTDDWHRPALLWTMVHVRTAWGGGRRKGWDSQAPVLMTENLLYSARAVVPEVKRATEQKENQISTLLGRNPGGIKPGKPLLKQDLRVTVPPGLPSSLLERRPDIRFAEEQLVTANARIGEAKALLFPTSGLPGVSDWESAALKGLFTGPASFWDIISPSVIQPIFTAGRLRASVRVAEGLGQPVGCLEDYRKPGG